MPLLKNDAFLADPWITVADDAPLPDGPVILSLARLKAEDARTLAGRAVGVRVGPHERVEGLEPFLPRLALVALAFPAMTDGRAFSDAVILRTRMGFEGELRAVGKVRVDLFQFMRRCGFDAYLIEDDPRVLKSWREAAVAMDVAYQTDDAAPGGPLPVWLARRRRDEAA